MSNLNARYRIDEPSILAEEISGEVLAIDNRTGCYMSITGSGVPIWNLIAVGHTPAEATEALAARFSGDLESMRAAVLAFVDRLVETGLVVVADRPRPDAMTMESFDDVEPFTAPVLDVYTDMEELLLFDPIHDVTEQGWPDIEPGASRG
jgi:hypothetical protein